MNIWPACAHEAGHAVVCQLVGGTVKRIEVFDRTTLDRHGRPISGRCRIIMPNEPLPWAMTYLAGPLAEQMIIGGRDWRFQARFDLAEARRLLFANRIDFEATWCRAEALVDRYRPRLVALATFLEHERAVEDLGPVE